MRISCGGFDILGHQMFGYKGRNITMSPGRVHTKGHGHERHKTTHHPSSQTNWLDFFSMRCQRNVLSVGKKPFRLPLRCSRDFIAQLSGPSLNAEEEKSKFLLRGGVQKHDDLPFFREARQEKILEILKNHESYDSESSLSPKKIRREPRKVSTFQTSEQPYRNRYA